MRWCSSLVLFGFLAAVNALSSSGNRLLVILEDATEKDLYSTFWGDLEARGYDLEFESPKNEKLSLFELGERAYDHLLIFPPKSKGFGPSLSPKTIVDFVNHDGNILLALSGQSTTPSAIGSLLLEFDIRLSSDRSSVAVDHFHYDTESAPEKHDVLVLERPGKLRPDTKAFFGGEGVLAFPHTAPHTLGDSSLLAPILRAPATAYSYNPKDGSVSVEDVTAAGSQLALVSAMQARNSARFTLLGSVESLQARGSPQLSRPPQLTAWTFKETGVLKVGKIEHHLAKDDLTAEDLNPTIYRIKNETVFSIEVSEYSYDGFVPFEVPSDDELQLEFTMLSPFHRLNLKPSGTTGNSTIFRTQFTVPDQHGIFSFRVNYKRPFLTNLEEKHEVTVRHFAHNEYPRSWEITGGWVWIAGLWSVIAGFLAFVIVWLYSESAPTTASKAKKMQ
ncbi:hypothetical protein AOCH_004553 [Aspergillus ochraceoroseus]|uniref:Dolichyl-diphosphooligosaccharide--protein glycosyltransferase subunit WBP1 n=1 Tax=Aspergillus ochraceoroseus TaxID=138278 RepID=A0A0F8VPR9_9EURO|nr:hypothetical protein AOCH_004553 [Aspergillus ochraceoroseus]